MFSHFTEGETEAQRGPRLSQGHIAGNQHSGMSNPDLPKTSCFSFRRRGPAQGEEEGWKHPRKGNSDQKEAAPVRGGQCGQQEAGVPCTWPWSLPWPGSRCEDAGTCWESTRALWPGHTVTNWTGSAAGPGLGARVPWKAGRVNTSLALFAEVSGAIVKLSQIPSRACLGGEGGGGRKFVEEVEALGSASGSNRHLRCVRGC